ncbi:four-carbon acid sugar kinase family protein [Pararobbsia alpina]|uniref:D-threonate kinase n=1 Tax=Pararobbsia alpina TaxID=621374 RepID=A0A6S7B6Z9_9BURK|nr:four-carbon acid sugar kinase family protein [Pararobbsia alpina]CAB3789468.1 D-threonate kinase [Pararobbsia alpina]
MRIIQPASDEKNSATSLLIIADDLSGAADCAIGFASAGHRTVVTLDSTRAPNTHAAIDVIATDTDTRRSSPEAAARHTVDAWRTLHTPGRRLYKKIDSTLRGNWAAEVAALQPFAGLAIVAPAFPATGRTTRGARVFVNGSPLETTDTWQLENAGQRADIAERLGNAGLSTAVLALDAARDTRESLVRAVAMHAMRGIQALIVDTQTSKDLALLAQASAAMDEALFWVGSAGLAREMALLPDLFGASANGHAASHVSPASPAPSALQQSGPILVLVGTLSAVSDAQCAMLRDAAGIAELVVAPAVLRAGPEHMQWPALQARIGAHLASQADLLLRIGRDDLFDPAQGAHLSTALGHLIAPHFGKIGGLIATGGETARAALHATGIDSLELVAEVEPGVAIGRPLDARTREGHAHRPCIVTKAGAFGTAQSLHAAWRHLRDSTYV